MSKLPTKKQIQDWIKDNPKKSSKREIAKAFRIKGSMRVELKQVLKELTLSGEIDKHKKSLKTRMKQALPPTIFSADQSVAPSLMGCS